MLEIGGWRGGPGTMGRRSFLRVGALGVSGLALPDQLRRKALAAARGEAAKDAAVIQVFLNGGPSHIDLYDPKPDAPAEFRGEFRPIATAVPGVSLSELLPRQARLMEKLAIIRSVCHTTSDHSGGTHWVMTGYPSSEATPRGNERPSSGSIAARVVGSRQAGLPPYVGIPTVPAFGRGAYLGPGLDPFARDADAASDKGAGADLDLPSGLSLDRLEDRHEILRQLDRIERRRDALGAMAGIDRFVAEAYAMVTGPAARRAFDLSQEDPRIRDRYGRTSIGQGCLLARRLVEAGVAFVTVVEPGWDHHTEVFPGCRKQGPPLDAAIAGLVEDLHERGLDRRVLVLVWGEFGRTPRINGSSGRDHWPGCMSAVLAGGGINTGQVIGATNRRGEYPVERALRPEDVLRTVYEVLGIDAYQEFPNEAGRPMPVLNQGRPIAELLA